MKKFTLSIACCLLCFTALQAQNDWMKTSREEAAGKIKKDDTDTVPKLWRKGLNINVNVNQGSLSNWAAGGDNFSFSRGSTVYGFAFYKKGKHSWYN